MKTLLALVALALPAAGGAEPLRVVHDRLFIPVIVNGERTEALLDSAAEMTILDDDFARHLNLAVGGDEAAHGSGAAEMRARFADHVAVETLGGSMELRVGILDLDEVGNRLVGRPLHMLLGRDLFDETRLRIDIAGGTIEAFDGRPRGVLLPVGEHRGTPTVPAAVEGHGAVQAVFDTGNGSGVLVGSAYARRIGLTGARIVGREEGGGLGGARRRDIVVLRSLTLAGRSFRNVRAAIDPGETASDLNIGTSILRHFVITTDFAGHRVWLEPRS
ncbi:MAG: aspartyl protease family protein [Sphingomonadaceae bacterium]|nr:aspartyl protease family protein [Sphingomonadaceae bacterium]